MHTTDIFRIVLNVIREFVLDHFFDPFDHQRRRTGDRPDPFSDLHLQMIGKLRQDAGRFVRLHVAQNQRYRLRMFTDQQIGQLLNIGFASDIKGPFPQLDLSQYVNDFFGFLRA